MEKVKYIIAVLLIPSALVAADPPFRQDILNRSFFDRNVLVYYTGPNLEATNVQAGDQGAIAVQRRSSLLAATMSAAIPGAGEAYVGHWWRAFVHLGIEITGWALYFHYDSRGDSQTRLYQQYADQYWDVTKYSRWLNIYWGANIYIDPDVSRPPWERVDWNQINDFERMVGQFSHRLEPFGTQQYYELIGKYPQYTRGWKDSNPIGNFNPTDEEIAAERIAYFEDITEMFSYYSGKRGYANRLYGRAHNAVMVVFVNHVLSAFHAAFLAHRFNETHFAVDVENRNDLYGERFVPTLRLHVGL